jgi:hypothetical protein
MIRYKIMESKSFNSSSITYSHENKVLTRRMLEECEKFKPVYENTHLFVHSFNNPQNSFAYTRARNIVLTQNIENQDLIQLMLLWERFFLREKRLIGQVSSNTKILPAQYPRYRSQEYQRQGIPKLKEELMNRVRREFLTKYYPLGGRLLNFQNR